LSSPIHNNSDSDIAIAPEGFAVVHLNCAEKDSFSGYFNSDDYTDFIEGMGDILRDRYVPTDHINESNDHLEKLNESVRNLISATTMPLSPNK
jgi:hypothetical protein